MTKIEEMRDTLLCDMERELERVKADNAALREAVGNRKDSFELGLLALGLGNPEFQKQFCECDPDVGDSPCSYCAEYSALRGAIDCADLALSITKPSNYVSKDAVRPLAECLQHIKETALNARCEPSITVAAIGLSAYGGVCVAIELGLLDK